jgi:mono/diheme cytochrome c family protein
MRNYPEPREMIMWRAICFVTAFLGMTGTCLAQSPLERGRYLVNGILGCGNCHTPQGPQGLFMDRELSGGSQVFDEPVFKVKGSNITPDRETGIGAWSATDIKRALTQGMRPNGVPLAPIMPVTFYKAFTPGDLDAVVAYLRSVKPIRNEVSPPEYKAAFTYPVYPGAEKQMAPADLVDPVKKGFYLATIGHCMECHTPRVAGEPQFKTALGKGGQEFHGPWGTSVSSNITSHPKAGIGAWSDAEIKAAITQGISRDGHRLKPPMFFAAYSRMSAGDLDAVVAWLRTVPPQE